MKSTRPGGYKLLRNQNNRGAIITVPVAMARVIPDEAIFDVEMTEEGLLYRFRELDVAPPPDDLPAWIGRGRDVEAGEADRG